MTYNETMNRRAQETIANEYIVKAGRIATKEQLLHLRNERGELIPKKIMIDGGNFVLVKPITIGLLNEHFDGIAWGEPVNIGLKKLVGLLAEHIVLEGGDKLTANDMIRAFSMVQITNLLDEWFTMSGLKPDEETMKKATDAMAKAKAAGITVGDDPKSK